VNSKQQPDLPDLVEEGPAAPAPKKSKKKLFIIGGAAAVVLLGGGGAATMLMSGGGGAASHAEASAEADQGGGEASGSHGGGGEGEAKFIDVPPLVVNLRSPDGSARFLKVHFMLVPGPKGNEETIKEKLPLILDAYQPFLRELRPEDLAGSAAVFRIKEELLRRAAGAAGSGFVEDVLIQDLVQQ
jgi:flagellar protein FliL